MKFDMSNHRWARQNPDLGTGPVSVEPCHSQPYFELEKEKIFKQTWLMVGRAEDIPNAGDYLVQDLAVADTSALVARGRDGVIRAFHNVCPHRGNKLVWDKGGCGKSVFVCPFHRWTFDLSGHLRGVTDQGNFFDLIKSELGLTSIACDVWNGFIFVNLDPAPKQALLKYLDGLASKLKDYPISDLRFAFGWTVDERSNWKVAMDAQNETYHVPYLHSVGQPAQMFMANETGSTRNVVFERYGRHSMFGNAPRPDAKPTAMQAFAGRFGGGPFSADHVLIGNFNFYVFFPNSAVVLFPGGVVANHRMWPLGPDRTRWEIRIYTRPPTNPGEALSQELFKAMGRNALQEDAANHERVQSTLKSGAIKNFMLQDEEVQIRFFHKMIDDCIAGKMD